MIPPQGELTPRNAPLLTGAHPTFRPAFPRFHTSGQPASALFSYHRRLPKQEKPALFSVGNESGTVHIICIYRFSDMEMGSVCLIYLAILALY
jgi:hypothetical protein